MDHEQIELRVIDSVADCGRVPLAVQVVYLGGIITMPVENLEDFIEALAEKSNRLKDSLERNYTTPSTN